MTAPLRWPSAYKRRSAAFKDRVADIAARRGMSVKFEDRRTQAQFEKRKNELRPERKQETGQARRPTVQAVVAREREQQKQQQKQQRGISRLWRG